MKKNTIALLSSLTLLFASQYALASDEQKGSSDRRGPPPEAFAACEGMSAGDTSEFSGRNGESVAGTCQEGKDGTLVLRPDNAPSRGGQRGE